MRLLFKKRFWVGCSLGLGLLAFSPLEANAAQTAPDPLEASQKNNALVEKARSFIQEMGESAIEVLIKSSSSRFQDFKKTLMTNFDLPAIAQYLLGRNEFNKLSPSQRKEYETLLPDYIVKIYLSKFQEYQNGKFLKENFQVKRAFLRNPSKATSGISVISDIQIPHETSGNTTLKVEWRVFDTKAGLKILDVYVDDLSMSQTKRDEFQQLIKVGELRIYFKNFVNK